jgi:hypothetical protein
MRALTVIPMQAGSLALSELDDPVPGAASPTRQRAQDVPAQDVPPKEA